jgi:hypothetical protein
VVYCLLLTADDDAEAVIAERRASGIAKEGEEFMVIPLVALESGESAES